jgi:membrane-associated phospholipid phosphatase
MFARLLALALLAATSLLLFFPINSSTGRLKKSRVIQHIPFIPAFIVPYIGYYPYVAFSMLAVLWVTPVAARLYTSLIFSGLVASLIWYLRPTVVLERPTFLTNNPLHKTVAWVYKLDPGGNASPSAHAYTTLLCSYYLTYAFPTWDAYIWSCGALIVSSTLFIKQHHVSDLIAGGVLAVISIGASYLILGGLT